MKSSRAVIVLLAGLCSLTGCAAEMGRTLNDTDISCLRKQMGARVQLSFPLAANTCQRMTGNNVLWAAKHPTPIPLNLHGAPDLQALAQEYGYSFTR